MNKNKLINQYYQYANLKDRLIRDVAKYLRFKLEDCTDENGEKYTLKSLAKKLNCSLTQIHHITTGNRKPTDSFIKIILEADL